MQSYTAAAPARPKDDAGHEGKESQRRPYYGFALLAAFAAGCGPTLREAIGARTITNTRASGLAVLPLGEGPESPKLLLGTVEHSFSPTATDKNGAVRAAAIVNRLDVAALGTRTTSTTAMGDVGNEMKAAGDVLVHSLEALHGRSTQPPPASD